MGPLAINVVYIHTMEYFQLLKKKEGNSANYNNIDESRGHYAKGNEPDTKG